LAVVVVTVFSIETGKVFEVEGEEVVSFEV
jgi:hypothetical protein